MRKILIAITLFSAAILLVGVQVGFAWDTYEGGCQTCHGSGFSSPLHTIHTGQACTICHPGAAGALPIPTSNCAGCHPPANPGLCPLINDSTAGTAHGQTCLACHTDCAPITTTTTVPETTTTFVETTTTTPETTTTTPPAEDCFNDADDDGDGDIDCADSDCNGATDGDCDTSLLGICAAGTLTCVTGEEQCIQNNQPVDELCNDGLDNDCDGLVDEDCAIEIEVSVDIKPGSCPNPIGFAGNRGVMPFAIMGTTDFDITQIDPESIRITREGVDAEVSPIRWNYSDVGTPFEGEVCDCDSQEYDGEYDLWEHDGQMDLLMKVYKYDLVYNLKLQEVAGETIPLTVTGKLKDEFGSTSIKGQDCVRVLKAALKDKKDNNDNRDKKNKKGKKDKKNKMM